MLFNIFVTFSWYNPFLEMQEKIMRAFTNKDQDKLAAECSGNSEYFKETSLHIQPHEADAEYVKNIKQLLINSKFITYLNLTVEGFTLEQLKEIFNGLKYNTTIKKLKIRSPSILNPNFYLDEDSYNDYGDTLARYYDNFDRYMPLPKGWLSELASIFEENKSLTYLNLNSLDFRRENLASFLDKLAKSLNITHLSLKAILCEEEDYKPIMESLIRMKTLKYLNLSQYVTMANYLIEYLAQLPTYLEPYYNNFGITIKLCSTDIDTYCECNKEGTRAIATLLEKHKNMSFDLSENNIGEVGIKLLLGAIRRNSHIINLDLSNQKPPYEDDDFKPVDFQPITDETLIELKKALENNNKIFEHKCLAVEKREFNRFSLSSIESFIPALKAKLRICSPEEKERYEEIKKQIEYYMKFDGYLRLHGVTSKTIEELCQSYCKFEKLPTEIVFHIFSYLKQWDIDLFTKAPPIPFECPNLYDDDTDELCLTHFPLFEEDGSILFSPNLVSNYEDEMDKEQENNKNKWELEQEENTAQNYSFVARLTKERSEEKDTFRKIG